MAEEKITLRFLSTFSGEGFQKASNAVRTFGGRAAGASRAIQQTLGAFGAMSGPIGETTRQITGVVGALASMDIAGAAVAGMSLAVKKLTDSWDELRKAAEEAATAQRKAADQTFENHLKAVADALKEVTSNAAMAAKQFEVMHAASAKIQGAKNATESSAGAANIAMMQWQKQVDLVGLEGTARELTAASHDLAIARAEAANAEVTANAKYDQQVEEIGAATERVITARDTVAKAEAALALAQDEERKAISTGNKGQADKFTKAREQAETALANAQMDLTAKEAAAAEAQEKATQLINAQSAARSQAESRIIALQDAEDKLRRRTEEEAAARERAAQIEDQHERAKAEAAKAEADLAAAEKAEIQAVKDRKAALDKQIESADAANRTAAAGMAKDAAKSTFGGGYQYHVDANGNINDPEDLARANRFAARAARDARAQERHNANYEKKGEALEALAAQKGERNLTQSQQQKLAEFRQWKKARFDKDAAEKEKAALDKKLEQFREQVKTNLDEIRKNLKSALEVK